jgi:hypothetical protein
LRKKAVPVLVLLKKSWLWFVVKVFFFIYIYIYIYREREREREMFEKQSRGCGVEILAQPCVEAASATFLGFFGSRF